MSPVRHADHTGHLLVPVDVVKTAVNIFNLRERQCSGGRKTWLHTSRVFLRPLQCTLCPSVPCNAPCLSFSIMGVSACKCFLLSLLSACVRINDLLSVFMSAFCILLRPLLTCF